MLCKVCGENGAEVIRTKEGSEAISHAAVMLQVAQTLGKLDVILHVQNGDTLNACGDQT